MSIREDGSNLRRRRSARHRPRWGVVAAGLAVAVLLGTVGCSSSSGGPAIGPNLITIDGQARSVETTAPLTGLSSVHLAGSSVLAGTANVTDHTGHRLGTGRLEAVGPDLVVSGAGISVLGRLRVEPGLVTLNGGDNSTVTLDLSGSSTIAAGVVTFQAPASPVASTASPTATAEVPAAVTLTGPVTVASGSLQVTGTALRFLDAPTEMKLTSAEADVSWAGSGSITTASGAIHAPYLGVRAQHLNVAVHSNTTVVNVHGTGLAVQAFADGVPQLRTTAGVEIASTHAATGFLDQKRAFVWTPRNLGPTYDMAILRIHPGNAAAGSVHLGLQPMPPMFGGEPHGLVGGDTSGFKGGSAIDSLIARHGDDKRTIGYDAPPGVWLVLILEGNFDSITVTVRTY